MNEYQDVSLLIARLAQADEQQQIVQLNEMVDSGLDEGSLANLLEAFPVEQRVRMWRNLPLELHIPVLTEMRSEVRFSVINALSEAELKLTLAKLDNLSLIEWADSLPEEIIADAMRLISRDELELYDRAKEYSDEEIGRWAEQKVFTLPIGISVKRAKVLLDKYQFETPKYVYLTNRAKKFRGMVLYSDIVTAPEISQLKALAQTELVTLNAHQSINDAIDAIEHSDVPVVPVVDENESLVGHVDWQFALNTQREIYEARLMAGTGMDEGDDLFTPVIKGTKKRGLWLGINLLTAILASMTIGMFEDVISKVVALAVLMPIVASMGGIAGSQTLTLMVRGMALNQVTQGNRFALLKNELSIGSINGVIWAVIIGGIAGLWFQSAVLGSTIALAIVINMATAAFFGVIIPILLDKFKLDPALAGSVILTTMTDVIGFFAFLGTASLVML
ncbi:CBS domain-containing protein [Vibrio sp. CAIM 722]|uniref:CBS domain-containing protein n=1 Tax=Vibrio eleionomae TaxID=2653505 RepID=A0A7X4LPM4_9VIBR|nr:magnesium transporter [Vibrio eleionomae]MZI95850.1 CBS domain-containing protein [Vibrio eleionomae]